MSATRAKKVKMATKSCPECDQQALIVTETLIKPLEKFRKEQSEL